MKDIDRMPYYGDEALGVNAAAALLGIEPAELNAMRDRGQGPDGIRYAAQKLWLKSSCEEWAANQAATKEKV